MEIAYFNGSFIPKEDVKISPDDRGFLFADGIYEVVRWYEGFFYDIDSHVTRLKRSLLEMRINWAETESFPAVARELIKTNKLEDQPAMVYLQVTRGAARRTHSFPSPQVAPTIYANAWRFVPDIQSKITGIKATLAEDIRWSRCDIKSIALLANTLCFQDAYQNGAGECIFVRNGFITEGSRSNIFFIIDGVLYTHPESNHILSGVTRRNVLRIAREAGISIREDAVREDSIRSVHEAFIANTSAEITPVTTLGGNIIGNGVPGPVTCHLTRIFDDEIKAYKGRLSDNPKT
jgi:D-alanine transaminase